MVIQNDDSSLSINSNAPINAKPHPTLPEHRWGFVQLIIQKTHPSENILHFPHIRRSITRFITLFHIPSENEQLQNSHLYGAKSQAKDVQTPKGGVGLDIDRCIAHPLTDAFSNTIIVLHS